jgi:hypothetical protein
MVLPDSVSTSHLLRMIFNSLAFMPSSSNDREHVAFAGIAMVRCAFSGGATHSL